ncbi:hypothetical protein DV735_g1126, partial [Chaetothyriales sp. CBS 134920]
MACSGLRPTFRALLREAAKTNEVPGFLLPAYSPCNARRPFSSSRSQLSRIGRAAISIPPEVDLRFLELPKTGARSRRADTAATAIEVKGPLGELSVPLPSYIVADLDSEAREISIRVADPEEKHQRAMWGTMRAHVANSIAGVSEGHVCILRLVGVGYRAEIHDKPTEPSTELEYEGQKFLFLKLGFAHPVELGIPKHVKVTVPQPARILLEGPEKQVVTQFAAVIRKWRKPEPYKGKGIFVNDETIRLKAKKIK